jgi:hypothetical protein
MSQSRTVLGKSMAHKAVMILAYAVLWLLLMMFFAALIGGHTWPTYRNLARRSVSVQGTVTQVLPKMHGTVKYRYYVDGREYHDQKRPSPPNPPIGRLTEGATLRVWYDPEQPNISVLGLPSALLENETIAVMLGAVFSPTLILFAWGYRMRPKPTAT